MTQADERDSWDETFLITIQEKGGTAFEFNGFITTYDVQGGEKGFDTVPNGAGGRIKTHKPETDTEVVLEGYFTQVGDDAGADGLMYTDDTTQPLSISNDFLRKNYMVSIMHTTNASQASAIAVTTDGDRAQRVTYKNGEFIAAPEVFTDSSKKTTLRFKVPPRDKSGSSNITKESTDGSDSATLPAVTYT